LYKGNTTRKLFSYTAATFLAVFCCAVAQAGRLHDGDIIFQTSRSAQSVAIRKATHSKYSHTGIIFFRDGKPYVYEAVRNVGYTLLQEWIARGEGGHYVVKRLRGFERVLTPQDVMKLRQVAASFQGKPYDLTFEWSDDRIYCSELVWKIYDRGIGVRLGRLQRLRDFDLSDPAVKAIMKKRFGNRIPLDETVISPGEMFSSDKLMIVEKR
jgi:hypothetical protein